MRETNGQQYQHATVQPVVKMATGDFRIRTHKRVSVSEEVPSEATRDAQGRVDGFTYGDQSITAEIDMKLAEWLSLRAALLSNADGLGVMQSVFDLAVSFGNNINALKTDTLRGCHVTRDQRESSSDQAELVVTVPLFVTAIEWADGPAIVYET